MSHERTIIESSAIVVELTEHDLEAVAGGKDADRAQLGYQNGMIWYECTQSPYGICAY